MHSYRSSELLYRSSELRYLVNIVYDIEHNVLYDIVYDIVQLLMCVYSGGMFHYSTKANTYGINNPDWILYKKDDHNPLINEFSIYIINSLCTFQNMQIYTVTPDTDLNDYVTKTITLHDGTVLYCFSKELLAYLETIVAFSPYYIQNDPCTAGVMDNFYRLPCRPMRLSRTRICTST